MCGKILNLVLLICLSAEIRSESRVAIAHLVSQNVSGSVIFTEVENSIRVTGAIIGLGAGKYGFHVHELGDTSTCDATAGHFDPDGNNHGGRDHAVRHVGDLGNVEFVGDVIPVANIDFLDSVISLRGRNSIIGRTLVLHEQEDDLGLGGDEGSLIAGNAGPRVACGVIGIRSPSDPWNSSVTVLPSLTLLMFAVTFVIRN